MYCSTGWTLSKSDENRLAVWQRKIMRRILGLIKENGVWSIRTDKEFIWICVVNHTISQKLEKEDYETVSTRGNNARRKTRKELFKIIPEGKAPTKKPRR